LKVVNERNQSHRKTDREATIEKMIETVASRNGWMVQPDARLRERLVRTLVLNSHSHGRPFCPCKSHVPIDTSSDEVCPCKEAHEEIATRGRCDCGLFIDAEAIAAKRRPGLLATILCPG